MGMSGFPNFGDSPALALVALDGWFTWVSATTQKTRAHMKHTNKQAEPERNQESKRVPLSLPP